MKTNPDPLVPPKKVIGAFFDAWVDMMFVSIGYLSSLSSLVGKIMHPIGRPFINGIVEKFFPPYDRDDP